jgi:DNA-binding winged helix-turn-helix (wHTH) protein/tetratricopeptide (TPR) repeat protein
MTRADRLRRHGMNDTDSTGAFEFAGFRLDPLRGSLLDPSGAEVSLRPKSFDLLRHLLINPGRVVSRDELMESVWPGVFVTDDSITQCVTEIRRAIGNKGPHLLRTLPKRGYILAADVASLSGIPPSLGTRQTGGNEAPAVFDNVPPRLVNFTGREAALSELHRLLAPDTSAGLAQVSIHGLGGVGKTSLAIEYVHRHARDYAGVAWAHGENRPSLLSSLAGLAGQMEPKLAQVADQEKAARAGLALIARWNVPFLLVYDNVESPEVLRELVPSTGARVLVTTRWSDWGGRATEFRLDVLDTSAAVEFLQTRADRGDAPGAARLADALGLLPLALDHAAAYCRLTGVSFDVYRDRVDELVARVSKGAVYPESVAATFGVAIEKAGNECASAGTLLGLCAYLAPERIPVDLFSAEIPNANQRAEALLSLAAVSLIEHIELEGGNPAVSLHRLVQTAMRTRLEDQGQSEAIAARVTKALADAFPKYAYRSTSVWPLCAVLVPHVIALAATHSEPGGSRLAGLLNAAGSYLHRRGLYSEAEPLLRRSITIGDATLGSKHPELAIWRSSLARHYRDIGRYVEAEPLLREALAISREALGNEHPDVIVRLTDLAHLYLDTLRHRDAEPLLKEAIAVGEKAFGRGHSSVAIALGTLARLYHVTGRHGHAAPLFEEAIATGRAALGREHPSVAMAIGREALDTAGAEALDGDVNEVARDHPDVALQFNNLAYLYAAAGQPGEAEPLLKEALAMGERALGRDHPDIAFSLNSLARLYRTTGRYNEAEPLLVEAIAISEKHLGREHPIVAIRLYNLARLYQELRHYEQAEGILRELVATGERTVGQSNPATARARWALANLLLAVGRDEEALQEADAAVEVHEKLLGRDHPWTSDSLRLYGVARQRLNRGAE